MRVYPPSRPYENWYAALSIPSVAIVAVLNAAGLNSDHKTVRIESELTSDDLKVLSLSPGETRKLR